MTRQKYAAVLTLLAAVLLLGACGNDRFSDSGCQSDSDCRGERVCQQGLCVGEGSVEPQDDGGNGDTMPDAVMQDIGNEDALEPFLGTWELDSRLNITDEQGTPIAGPDRQTLGLTIREAGDADLLLDIPALDGCNITADLRPSGTGFIVTPVECEENPLEGAGGTMTVVEGSGALTPGDQLELQLTLEIDSEEQPSLVFIDIQATGERISP